MNIDNLFDQRIVCVVVIEQPELAVPLAEALVAGGLRNIEVTFRTVCAAEAISRIRRSVPAAVVGAGTLLTADELNAAVDVGAQFGVSPGLSKAVSKAAQVAQLPFFPGVVTPSEIIRALDLGWRHLKFFPAQIFGGLDALRALMGPFGHTGLKFIPTGGITATTLPDYLALPQVAAVGGSWMAERRLVAEKQWAKITGLAKTTVAAAAMAS